MRALLGAIAAGALLLLTGCGQSDEPRADARRADSAGVATDAPTEGRSTPGGTIEITVRYQGDPVEETVHVHKDHEACGATKRIETIGVGPDRGLKDAVVSIASADRAAAAPPAEVPVLDQKGCEFRPHVLAMMPGEVRILNSDGVLHNIHTESTANPPVNKAQPRFKKEIRVTLEQPEIVRVRCDVHSWMEAWIAVLPHPYFAVTGEGGTARIESVPPGPQTIEVWHPVAGKQTRSVDVEAGKTTAIAVEMTSG
jgi:hypothetical protein